MPIQSRYKDNLGILTDRQQEQLHQTSVLLVGCGGIGGHVANQLVRLGVGRLILVDFDRFEEANLNRQLFCTVDSIGHLKVDVVASELKLINPDVVIEAFADRVENVIEYIRVDYVIDAVDDPSTKVFLNHQCTNRSLSLLHGACAGWYGQVGWLEPGCLLLQQLYQNQAEGLENELRNPSFTPAFTASYMVAEFVKYCFYHDEATINRLLLIDVRSNAVMSSVGGDSDG